MQSFCNLECLFPKTVPVFFDALLRLASASGHLKVLVVVSNNGQSRPLDKYRQRNAARAVQHSVYFAPNQQLYEQKQNERP